MMIVNNQAVLTESRKLECELDGLYFARYFFKKRFGSKMIVNRHHDVLQETLDKVVNGEISRLIINIPPRYTKTEMATINFIARGLALNPLARFMHLSYSDTLALDNSSKAKSIVESQEYQDMWEIKLKDDAKSKKLWWTDKNGGVYATSAGGQVTGFGAGTMEHSPDNFTGALIIDDPVKPDDAYKVERENVNNRFNETIKSRIAVDIVPIIVIMQRIHDYDLSGYLLRGGSGEKWHHLNLPVYIDNSQPYNKEYTHGIPIEHGLDDGWLWDFRHNDKHKEALISHRRTYWCQYMQAPDKIDIEGALWTTALIEKYKLHKIPDGVTLRRIVIGVDPSGDDGKEKTESKKADEIGIVACGMGTDNHYYVIDDSSLNGSPATWSKEVIKVHNANNADCVVAEKNYGGAMVEDTIRNTEGGKYIRYKAITSSRGKILRAEPIAALYEQGLVHHVGNFPIMESEMTTYNGTGKSPNRLDSLVFSLAELSGNNGVIKKRVAVGLY